MPYLWLFMRIEYSVQKYRLAKYIQFSWISNEDNPNAMKKGRDVN